MNAKQVIQEIRSIPLEEIGIANISDQIAHYTQAIDDILISSWQYYQLDQQADLCLLALGGYGRRTLHPYSDLDLLILSTTPLDQPIQQLIEQWLRDIWDLELACGHSVRTLEETMQDAQTDLHFATNILENRLLSGDKNLHIQLNQCIDADDVWDKKHFFLAKTEEQIQRHAKFDHAAYSLEPDIKNSPGGLRDLHMIIWVTKKHFQCQTLEDLVSNNFLSNEELQILQQGQQFLWLIRYFLHRFVNRKEDRLLFDHQKSLAKLLNYYDSDYGLGVEKFMRDYFRTIKSLRALNDMLLQLFREVILTDQKKMAQPINDRFEVLDHYLSVRHDKVFQENPKAFLELFILMAKDPEIKGVRANTIRLLRNERHLLKQHIEKDPKLIIQFYELLRQPTNIYRLLKRMNRYGLLDKIIPAYQHAIGQMQFDLYHIYTVDQHSLFVVRNLNRFRQTEFAEKFPLCHKIINTMANPELVILAGLFHDIGKGHQGDHSRIGAQIAQAFCQGLQMQKEHIALVSWLVEFHLLMSQTAQKQDIYDPAVIDTFAEAVNNQRHLNALYVLTVADICATNPKLWNSWRNSLLSDLYQATSQLLKEKTRHINQQKLLRMKKRKALKKLLERFDRDTIKKLWHSIPRRYFLREPINNIIWHTEAILDQAEVNTPLVLIKQCVKSGGTEFFIYSRVHREHFATTAKILSQQQLAVLEARVFRTKQAMSMDSFIIMDQYGHPIKDEDITQRLQSLLCYYHRSDITAPKMGKWLKPRTLNFFAIQTQVSFHQPINAETTLIEITTADRPGLLAKLGEIFRQHEVRVTHAKIATIGEKVEDAFYITNEKNKPFDDSEKQKQLRDSIIKQLS